MFDLKFTFVRRQSNVLIDLPIMRSPIRLSASDLDDLIRKLAWLRRFMAPSHYLTQPTPDTSIPATQWLATADTATGTWGLHLLHPGLGWISIPLDPNALDNLINGMRLYGHEMSPHWRH